MISNREIEKTLGSWAKRHGLLITDVYRDSFFYVDVIDDVGGKYEISLCKDDESDSINVGVWHQKKRYGYRVMDLPGLERVLDHAYSKIIEWMKQSKGTRLFPA